MHVKPPTRDKRRRVSDTNANAVSENMCATNAQDTSSLQYHSWPISQCDQHKLDCTPCPSLMLSGAPPTQAMRRANFKTFINYKVVQCKP